MAVKVPGELVFRDKICDECRDLHGEIGAVSKMAHCVGEALQEALENWPKGEEHRLHVVVTHETEHDD